MKGFPLLVKPVSDRCPLHCSYCFFKGAGLSTEDFKVMTLDTLRRTIRIYESCCPFPAYIWQGGEPLLAGLEFYREAVRHQGPRSDNHFVTSGVGLDQEWASFFGDNDWVVGISLDGPWSHRGYDVKMTHTAINLLEENSVRYGLMCVVSSANVMEPRTTVAHLAQWGDFVTFVPCQPNAAGDDTYCPSPKAWASFLQEACIEAKLLGLTVTNLLDAANAANGFPTACHNAENCLNYLAVDGDGGVYPCDFFMKPEWRLESVHALPTMAHAFLLPKANEFARLKGRGHADCVECQSLPSCGRGCVAWRVNERGDPRDKDPLCEGHQTITRLSDQSLSDHHQSH